MQNDRNSRKIRHVGAQPQSQAPASASEAADAAIKGNISHKPHNKHHKKKKSKAGRIALYVLLALLVTGGVLLVKFYSDINNPQALFQDEVTSTPEPSSTPVVLPGAVATPEPSPTPDPEAQLLSQADMETLSKDRVNILVLGIDESTERANWGSFRTDTMILVTINLKTNDVDMISIPRDSYVKICNGSAQPTGRYDKVNSAFSAGGGAQKSGYAYAMGTVQYLLGGIQINHYIGFNMNVVKEVVNAMGGVDYDVDIDVSMNGRVLHPGMQHMDGQAVLDYSRQRKGSSDIARVDRQQRILFAIFNQLKSTGQIANIPQIYKAVEQNIQTDLNFKQISALALIALRMNTDQLGRHTVDGEFLNMDSTSYWGLNTGKMGALIKDVFGVSVSVDEEIGVSNVRKRYEESQALLSNNSSANAAMNTAHYILTTFEANLTENAKSRMADAVDQLKAALQAGDEAVIEQCIKQLNSLNANYIDQLRKSGLLEDNAPQPESNAADASIPEAEEPPAA